ncbi:MATE family efflux transporter [Ochrovirga pacifica]|uniref:hypothetical protein n=1 Tax=Ochrovirga pacifica TaxID=1042376 RepID=UPI0002559E05|nr:hypothetical protein [Ochrovirga pacifica]
MNQANRVAKNSMILYGQMILTMVLSLYTTRLVLAALGTKDFGVFNVVGGAIAMLMFLSAAMTAASQRFMSFSSGQGDMVKQKQIFNTSLKMHLTIAAIMVFLFEILGLFLFDYVLNIDVERLEAAKVVYQCLVLSTFFTIIMVPYDAVINARENMLFFAIVRIVEILLKFSIALFITYSALDKLILYGILMAIVPIVLLAIKFIYTTKFYEEVCVDFKKYKEKALFKEMFSFAGWSFLGSTTGMITNYGQNIVVNMFFGTRVNAAQGVSNQVSGQLGSFANIMLRALNPVLAKSEGAGNRELLLKASMIGSKFSFYLLVVFFVPMLIEMPYVFELWLEEVPEYAIVFCKLLLVRNLVNQLFVTINSSIAAVGDIKSFQIISSVINFLPLIISYILFKLSYPPQMMYWVFIAHAFINGCIVLYFANIKCKLKILTFFNNVLLPCVLVFVFNYLLASIPSFFLKSGVLRIMITGLLSLILFALLVWTIGLQRNEKDMILKIISKLKIKLKFIK